MKMKGERDTCKHIIQKFDYIAFVDLGCKHYGMCHGTAIVTKQECRDCERMRYEDHGATD